MKDLIAKLLAAIPAYVRQMIDLLRDPRAFVEKLDLDSDSVLQDALTFLAISFGLTFIAEIPLLPDKQNKEIMFGIAAVQAALGFVVSVVLLDLSWRIVRGKLSFKKFVIVTCYFTGVSTLLFLMLALVAWGVFNSLDPLNAALMRNGTQPDPVDLMRSAGFHAFWILLALGLVATFIWIFRIWGAYRDLNQTSKARSAVAFTIYMLLSPLILGLQVLMGSSMYTAAPTPFPAELVGQWELTKENRTGEIATHHAVSFKFDPNGYYMTLDTLGTTNGHCYTMVNNGSYGHATVVGSALTLHVQKHTETTDNNCNGTKSETAKELINDVYQFSIRPNPEAEGQQLCLMGHFGETCLNPKKQ